MRITGAEILVDNQDKFEGCELFDCRIICDFPLFEKDYTAAKIFEIRGYFDDKSEDFKLVFENTDMQDCIVTGTDAK